jgi:cell division protein FtsQ
VRKRWPRGLEIYVVEQQPAAIWNGDMLLNEYGDVFNGQISDEQVKHALKLPTLFGPGGSEYTALQGYRNMQSLLDVTNLRIVEMFLSERFAWNIQLNNGVKLNLGRTEFIDRLQRFVDILPLISEQQKEVEYIDLRYDTGLAVGWKAQDKAA